MEGEKPKIIEAVQFNPDEKNWPKEVKPWDRIVPRDMSWGFVDTAFGRAHILAGDWICKVSTGDTILLRDRIYKKLNIQ